MGALISTIGTRYLISNFNREFSPPRIGHLRNQVPKAIPAGSATPAAAPIMEYFNDPTPIVDLLWLTQNITHAHSKRADFKCFLPEDSTRSKKAESRWLFFLTAGNPFNLTPANHTNIKSAIYTGLSSKTAGNFTYERIEFDCVDGGATQTVFSAPEKDDHGREYFKIVLVTAPIPANQTGVIIAGLDPLDPQPGP